ncbi:MAG: hypothetical protein AAF405_09155, partial [Pseudomonadota bacterium]
MTNPVSTSTALPPRKSWLPSQEDMDAIARGEHGDPFAVLGLKRNCDGASVRAFLPDVQSVTVFDPETGEEIPLTRLHPEGFFGAKVPMTFTSAYLKRTMKDG